MNAGPGELGKDADGFYRFAATFGVHRVIGQTIGAEHMAPEALAHDIRSSFIGMQDRSLAQVFLDLLLYGDQRQGTPLHHILEGANRHRGPDEILDGLTGSLIRARDLLLCQVYPNRSEGRTVLYWGRDAFGKARAGDCLTMGADLLLGLMLNHQDPLGRNIEDLTACGRECRNVLQIPLTGRAGFYGMFDDLIWNGSLGTRYCLHVLFALPAFLPLRLAQTFALPGKPIRGGRRMAVVTVLGETILQFFEVFLDALHFARQLRDGLLQLCNLRILLVSLLRLFQESSHRLLQPRNLRISLRYLFSQFFILLFPSWPSLVRLSCLYSSRFCFIWQELSVAQIYQADLVQKHRLCRSFSRQF